MSNPEAALAAVSEGAGLRGHAPLLRALADEARLTIVARLAAAGAPVCVCDLTPGLGLAPATVSHHLKVLRDAGVIRGERRGSWIHYSLDLAVLGSLAALIAEIAPRAGAIPRARACGPDDRS